MVGDSTGLRRVGHFELKRSLGGAALTERYAAVAEEKNGASRNVEVELLLPKWASERDLRSLFAEESEASLRVRHPNLLANQHLLTESRACGFVTDSPEGRLLSEFWGHWGAQSSSLALRLHILCEMLSGLQFAHELHGERRGVDGRQHGDIGPHTIWLGQDGRVYLRGMGFGQSLVLLTRKLSRPVVDLGYAAPEWLNGGDIDVRADVYSVGVMLWEALASRRRLFDKDRAAIVRRRLAGAEPAIETIAPDAPGRLVAVCRRALEPNADERYSCVAELREDLLGFLDDVYGEERSIQRAELVKVLRQPIAPLPSRTLTQRRLPLIEPMPPPELRRPLVPTQLGAGPPLGSARRDEPDTAGHAAFVSTNPPKKASSAQTRWALPGLGALLVCAVFAVNGLGGKSHTKTTAAASALAPVQGLVTSPLAQTARDLNPPTLRLDELQLVEASPEPNPGLETEGQPETEKKPETEPETKEETPEADKERPKPRRRTRPRRARARRRAIDERDPYAK